MNFENQRLVTLWDVVMTHSEKEKQ